MSVTCQRCGGDMPPLPDELAKVLASGAPVQIVHDVCPNEAEDAAADTGRYFEVRVQIVEVIPGQPATDVLGTRLDDSPEQVELIDFRHGVRADTLAEAMRPLATGLGEKWMRAEESAGIADIAPAQSGG